MSVNQIFKDEVSKLKFLYKTTQKGIAEKLGVTPQYLSDVINGRQPYNEELRKRVYELVSCLQPEQSSEGSLCFDEMTIQGGAGHGTGMERILSSDMSVGRMSAPGLPVGDDIIYIQVSGDSMANHKNPSRSIPSGAWVGIKESKSSTIQWGEVYAFMTVDGAVIKKVQKSDKEGCIRCVSFNVEDGYAPFDLPTNEIIGSFYIVVGVVTAMKWK